MTQFLNAISLLVNDYDQVIAYYTGKLGFALVEDTRLSDEKRWVLLAPRGAKETRVLLAKAANAEQSKIVGNQTGAGYFCFCKPMIFGMTMNA